MFRSSLTYSAVATLAFASSLGCASGFNSGPDPDKRTQDGLRGDRGQVEGLPPGCKDPDPCKCALALDPDSASLSPADIMTVFDKSGSMDDNFDNGRKKLDAVRDTVNGALPELADQGHRFGALAFPRSGGCDVDDEPQVDISSDYEDVEDFLNDIDRGDGNTPMSRAIEVAGEYFDDHASDGKPEIVLLVTDGEPSSDCGGDDVDRVVDRVETLFDDFEVRTAVVGVGQSGDSDLKRIAEAGKLEVNGAPAYFPVDSEDAIAEAFRAIALAAADCTFRVAKDLPDGWALRELTIDGKTVDPEDYEASRNTVDDVAIKLSEALCEAVLDESPLPTLKAAFAPAACVDHGSGLL